jgi:hypothetical protein
MQLVMFDTAGIQPYIFRSNRLRENLGASYLVRQVTEAWVSEKAREIDDRFISPDDAGRRIEDGGPERIEIIYQAGGNALVLTRDEETATALIRAVSEHVLVHAPGIRLVAARQDFEFNDSLADAMRALNRRMAIKKRMDGHGQPLLGLGVTKSCVSTGLPATGFDKHQGAVSAEVQAKLANTEQAQKRLERLLQVSGPDQINLEYPSELDDLGRTEEKSSLIAVVHADGDGMGAIFRDLGREHGGRGNTRRYIVELRRLSSQVDTAAINALNHAMGAVVRSIHMDGGRAVIKHPEAEARQTIPTISLKQKEDHPSTFYLPIRPIIFGGDDVTVVCDARIAHAFTTAYMEAFAREMRAFRDDVTASAGIAIVKSHYPFARAYELAEKVTASAKTRRRKSGLNIGFLDWHIVSGTIYDDFSAMRSREYTTTDGFLTLRPVGLSSDAGARSWPVVRNGVDGFQRSEWLSRRNKLKRLRDALRQGPDEVERLLKALRASEPVRREGKEVGLPALQHLNGSIRETGWTPKGEDDPARNAYFDAIELSDLYIPLSDDAESGN